jgi:DNA-directed RNA polymerase subunit RPC12/RpoP
VLQSNPELVKPRCSRCGAAMEPANVIPGLRAIAQLIFKCVKCERVVLISETRPDRAGVKK